MGLSIESYKKMQIPIPKDETILLVPRTMLWFGEWKDAIVVFTNKGIHFRVKKDRMFMVDYSSGRMVHSFLNNTFLAYDRIAIYKMGKMLFFIYTSIIQMVDGLSLRFRFTRDTAEVMKILKDNVQPGVPRNMESYDYASHKPESVSHQLVSAPK